MARRVRASRNLGFSALHCFNILKKFVDPWTILQAKSRDDWLEMSFLAWRGASVRQGILA